MTGLGDAIGNGPIGQQTGNQNPLAVKKTHDCSFE